MGETRETLRVLVLPLCYAKPVSAGLPPLQMRVPPPSRCVWRLNEPECAWRINQGFDPSPRRIQQRQEQAD